MLHTNTEVTDLREAKEESDASSDSKDLSCVDLDFICTRLTGVVGETHLHHIETK